MTAPILSLPHVKWDFTRDVKHQVNNTKLGDGYGIVATSVQSIKEVYEVVFPNLNTATKDNIVNTLIQYGGYTKFRWRPLDFLPYKTYICDKWSVIQQGTYLWQVTATFTEQRTA